MERYLIISPHTEDECKHAIAQVYAMGYITHFDWGCKDGEHCGWAIIEAENSKEALLVVPSLEREKARAVKLVRFTPAEIKAMHLG